MIKSFNPPQHLKTIIREYYVLELQHYGEMKKIPILDDCCHDIIFYKQTNAELVYGNTENIEKIDGKMFTILDVSPPYVLKYKDELTFFTIKFQPWMNNFFFGKLKQNGIVKLDDHYPELNSILKAIEHGNEIENVVENLNRYFENQSIALTPKLEMVKRICDLIYDQKGMVKVKEISAQFNKSRQYINKLFRDEVMCNIKTFATSVRIVDLVKYKSKHKTLSLTQLCYDYGYFDQAHFINDFKKVCGVTPSQYFGDLPDFILRHD